MTVRVDNRIRNNDRIRHDNWDTPKYAVEPLVPYVAGKRVWCPFDTEESEFVKTFRAAGSDVVASHIDNGEDFFSQTPPLGTDMIISNPPYSVKDRIIERCYSLGKPFLLLLPLESLIGVKRVGMYKANGVEIMLFNRPLVYKNKSENGRTLWLRAAYVGNGVFGTPLVLAELPKADAGYRSSGRKQKELTNEN